MRASARGRYHRPAGERRLTRLCRHGAGCLMPVDCRTADGGDVVPAVRTPRSAAATTRRQCLETSSPRWRRDKARQDEATRPGDWERLWENKKKSSECRALSSSCGLRNLCICCCLCNLVFVSLGFVGVLKLMNLMISNHMILPDLLATPKLS